MKRPLENLGGMFLMACGLFVAPSLGQQGPAPTLPKSPAHPATRPARSRPSPLRFTRSFAKGPHTRGLAVRERSEGGYWVAGVSGGKNFYKQGKLLLLRYDAQGKRLWTRSYEAWVRDHVDLLLPPGGGVLLVAARVSLLVDEKGEVLWKKRLLAPDSGQVTRALLLGRDRLVVAGWKRGPKSRGRRLWMGTLDLRADRYLWQRTWPRKAWDSIQALYLLPGGKLRAVGQSRTSAAGKRLMLVLSKRGKILQRLVLPGPNAQVFSTAYALAPHPSGLLLASNSNSYESRGSTGNGKTSLQLLTPQGELLREQGFRGSDVAQPLSLLGSKERFTLLFHQVTYAGPKGRGFARLTSWDAQLHLQWRQNYRWGENTRGRSLQATRDGGYVWTGWYQPKRRDPRSLDTERLLLVKVGPDGKAQAPQ
ncbi:MAG TPA: hypothetical protein ENK02_01975 [Planctomycetes bacterium]|nr:hypothetical protein [Planctomycetota bacterium]